MSPFDMEEPPPSIELTDFDKSKIEALDVGDAYTTENGLFRIVRYKDSYIISHGRTQVTMPGLFSVMGYLTH